MTRNERIRCILRAAVTSCRQHPACCVGCSTYWYVSAVTIFSIPILLLLLLLIIIIIITKTMFMVLSSWQSHCESSHGSFDERRMAPSGRRPKTKPDDYLGCESACTGCQKLHPPSPFIIITQPESWYSVYRPTEGRRLSRPSWHCTTVI